MAQFEIQGALLDIQPDADPIEYTHFDCWLNNPGLCDAKQYGDELEEILVSWEDSLSLSFGHIYEAFLSVKHAVMSMGFDNFMGAVVLHAMRAGYFVYEGDGFIEFYKQES